MMSNISMHDSLKSAKCKGSSKEVHEPCHKLTHQTSLPICTTVDSSTSDKQDEKEFKILQPSGNLLLNSPLIIV